MIVYQPEFIHDESFMTGIMDSWVVELPSFQNYLDHKLKHLKNKYFNLTSTTKSVPLKEVRKELLYTTHQDNKDSTKMIEDLGVVAATLWVKELLDSKKAT